MDAQCLWSDYVTCGYRYLRSFRAVIFSVFLSVAIVVVMLFFGTLFYAVSGDYGFNAPVLARLAPATLEAINAYPPVVTMDAAFVLLLFAGFLVLGIAIGRSRAFPAWSGVLIAGGWLLFTISAPLALFVFEPLWILVILGTVILGAGLAWIGFVLFRSRATAAA